MERIVSRVGLTWLRYSTVAHVLWASEDSVIKRGCLVKPPSTLGTRRLRPCSMAEEVSKRLLETRNRLQDSTMKHIMIENRSFTAPMRPTEASRPSGA
jgi:hypothetical protein